LLPKSSGQSKKEWLDLLRLESGCCICKRPDAEAHHLIIDHVAMDTKSGAASSMVGAFSILRAYIEILKCQIICDRCNSDKTDAERKCQK